jgi:two-component system NtrC family sensor kinase
MHSLQGKIIAVYLTLAALAIGLSLMALLELNLIAAKVRTGSKVAEFFDATLEVRRFEKNHFLYGQPEDLRENARYTERALELLQRDNVTFATLMGGMAAYTLANDLRRYQRLMAEQATRPGNEALAAEVRGLGKRIVTTGETLAARERENLRDALATHQRNLLISVAAVVGLLVLAGFSLARWVTRPLKTMEASMEAVAQGQLTRLDLNMHERELASLTQAFNHVLDELERRQHTLVRSEKLASLGTLLSGVAHELNNPLSNISSSAQILKEDLLPSPAGGGAGGEGATSQAQQPLLPHPNPLPGGEGANVELTFHQQLIHDIDQETQRAAQIVRSLLDYARDRDFQHRPVNLAELLNETLRFLKNLRAPGIEVRLDVAADLAVAADRPRLQQALLNLIKNALEAMGEQGQLSIAGHRASAGDKADDLLPVLAGSCRPGTAVVDLTIADTGHGVPPEVLPRIFDPFFTTKPVGHGNGLGLFIVYEIIDEHGGCIGVENLPEGGARFHIRLPIGAPDNENP